MDGCPSPDEWFALDADSLVHHLDGCAECRGVAAMIGRLGVLGNAPTATGDDPGLVPELVPAGATLGRFVVRGAIGAGGMGVLLEAYDPKLERTVALKVMRRLRGDPGWERARDRVLAEAKAMARLSHPNVVGIHDLIELGDEQLIAMEYVAGPDLEAWLAGGPTPRQRLLALVDVARGLAAAHAAGLVHRDVKPSNVVIDPNGTARVTDFGLVALAGSEPGQGHASGTPGYIAPEVLAGATADARADQYGFAVTAWRVLYDEWPPRDPAAAGRARGRLGRVLGRALATDPARRHRSMADVAEAMRAATQPRGTRLVVAAAALAVALAIVAVVLWKGRPAPSPGTGAGAGSSGAGSSGAGAVATLDPATRVVHDDIVAALAPVAALGAKGKYQEQLARLDQLLARVPANDPALRGELLYRRADALARTGDTAGSVPVLEEALAIAERAGNDVARVNTIILLLAAYEELGKTDETAALAKVAEAAAQRVPKDLARSARLANVLAGIAYQAGRYEEAERRYRELVAIDEERFAPGGKDAELAGALHNFGLAVHARGRVDEATTIQQRALAMFEATVGPAHPDTVLPVAELAGLAVEADRLDDAAVLYRRTIENWEHALGKTHPNLSEPLLGLGHVEALLGHREPALALYRRARASAAGFGTQHPLLAMAEYRLADELDDAGRRAEAAPLIEHSVATWDASGVDMPEAHFARFLLAKYRWNAGKHAEARALATRAHTGLAKLAAPYAKPAQRIAEWLDQHR